MVCIVYSVLCVCCSGYDLFYVFVSLSIAHACVCLFVFCGASSACRGRQPPGAAPDSLGWHYLSKATCLIRPILDQYPMISY